MLAKVNKVLKMTYPGKEIEAVAGPGYIYFVGADGEKIPSIYISPGSVSPAIRMRIVLEDVAHYVAATTK